MYEIILTALGKIKEKYGRLFLESQKTKHKIKSIPTYISHKHTHTYG